MTRCFHRVMALGMGLLLAAGGTAWAWGPRTQVTLVDFAVNLLAQEVSMPLKDRLREIREGVMIGDEELAVRHPNLVTALDRAIAAEMNLLRTVGRNGFDLYFAHRLGTLGKMVAMAAAPMREAPPAYRNAYEDDVDANIDRLSMSTRRRAKVEPASFATLLMTRAASRDELIIKDYQDGIGFKGVASQSLPGDASRAVDAIADAWYTILATDQVTVAISQDELRRYALGAYAYYIGRGNLDETEAALARLERLAPATPDMRVQLGDFFYESGFQERAMREYQKVLEVQPERREVIARIAEYYIKEGNRLLEAENLQEAYNAFQTALDADPANAVAQGRRMETERLINAREERRAAFMQALTMAAGFEAQADEHAMEGYYVEAIAAFNEALHEYEGVTPEFPELYNKAQQGVRGASGRIRELRNILVENVQAFSGSAAFFDLRAIAEMQGTQLDGAVLQSLVDQAYRSTFEDLERELQERLKVQ
jgi:tetratricopeptide (TPR) repeat protein